MSLLEDTPERFQAELEFINALSSPDFLLHLAHQRHLESEGFLRFESLSVPNDDSLCLTPFDCSLARLLSCGRYLKDLHVCWTKPAYAQYVVYPHALCFLELLQDPEFRSRISQTAFKEAVHAQQVRWCAFYCALIVDLGGVRAMASLTFLTCRASSSTRGRFCVKAD